MHHTLTAFLLTATALIACSPDSGQIGEEGIPGTCEIASRNVIDLLELSPDGIVPQDAIDYFLESHTGAYLGPMNWTDSPSSDGSFTVEPRPGPIEFVEVEFLEPETGNGSASPLDCIDFIAIPVTLHVETSDGALTESYETFLEVRDMIHGIIRASPKTFSGNLSPGSYVPTGYDHIATDIQANLVMSESWLSVHVVAQKPDSTKFETILVGELSEPSPL